MDSQSFDHSSDEDSSVPTDSTRSDSSDPRAKVEPTSTKPTTQHRGSLLVIFLTVFVDLLGFGLVIPLLPIYADQFAVDPSGWKLGLLMAIFSLMQFIFAPLWGTLSDRIGRRPVLMIGLLGSCLFYSLFAYATVLQSLSLIFVSRIGAGITGATIPTAQAYISDSTSPENRQRGMALIGMAFGLGFTLGPLFGFLAIPSGEGNPGAMPGIAAAVLSGGAFILAAIMLPESIKPNSDTKHRQWIDLNALAHIRHTPSVVSLLFAIFVCVFSFAAFETTLSLLIKGTKELNVDDASPFSFTFKQVCGTFALIGLTLAFIQGGFVRPLSKRLPEAFLATSGAALEVIGFLVIVAAVQQSSVALLFTSLFIVVTGFSFMQPSLNSLLSRRTDPSRQGAVLGIGQSTNAMARILGSGIGIPLLKVWIGLPFIVSAIFMACGAVFVMFAVRGGKDFEPAETPSDETSADLH